MIHWFVCCFLLGTKKPMLTHISSKHDLTDTSLRIEWMGLDRHCGRLSVLASMMGRCIVEVLSSPFLTVTVTDGWLKRKNDCATTPNGQRENARVSILSLSLHKFFGWSNSCAQFKTFEPAMNTGSWLVQCSRADLCIIIKVLLNYSYLRIANKENGGLDVQSRHWSNLRVFLCF